MVDGQGCRTLRPGEAIPLSELPAPALHDAGLYVSLSTTAGSTPDLVALLIGHDGRVRTDDDLVFYNNISSADGAVSWQGRSVSGEVVWLRCAALEAGISKIVFGWAAGGLDETSPVRLTLTIRDASGA